MAQLWGGRFTKETDQLVYDFNASILFDQKLIEEEIGYKMNHILTGGNAVLVKDYLNDYIYDSNLILDGLYHIYKKNS